MSKMKSAHVEKRTIEYAHRTDYIHTVEDPKSGTTYSLITHHGFYPIVVVTTFGNVIGCESFIDMRSKFGYGTDHIKLIGVHKN